jgi:putative FmdB family regulatory protein
VPTYSYRCTECGEAFDIVQAFTDDTLTVCPNCGGVLRKVFSPVGVSFSGSGFYRTDSRAAETKKKDAAGSGSGSGDSSSPSPSTSTSTGTGTADSTPAPTAAAPTSKPAPKSEKKSPSKKDS